jgi:hypothetical protein
MGFSPTRASNSPLFEGTFTLPTPTTVSLDYVQPAVTTFLAACQLSMTACTINGLLIDYD